MSNRNPDPLCKSDRLQNVLKNPKRYHSGGGMNNRELTALCNELRVPTGSRASMISALSGLLRRPVAPPSLRGILALLNSEKSNTSHPSRHMMSLHIQMRSYVATPYCVCGDSNKRGRECTNYPSDFKKGDPVDCSRCTPTLSKIDEAGEQSHGGDLWQHSQWAAAYVYQWLHSESEDRYALNGLTTRVVQDLPSCVDGLNAGLSETLLLMAAFFHDVAKGGDGFYDMYSSKKYGGGGENHHPISCGDLILCGGGKSYNGSLRVVMRELLEPFPKKSHATVRRILAVAAFTHWELGRFNGRINGSVPSSGWHMYVDSIDATIARVFDKKTISKSFRDTIVRLCVSVSCADIAAASNAELDQTKIPFHVSAETHLTNGGAWVKYDFRELHKGVIRDIDAILAQPRRKDRSIIWDAVLTAWKSGGGQEFMPLAGATTWAGSGLVNSMTSVARFESNGRGPLTRPIPGTIRDCVTMVPEYSDETFPDIGAFVSGAPVYAVRNFFRHIAVKMLGFAAPKAGWAIVLSAPRMPPGHARSFMVQISIRPSRELAGALRHTYIENRVTLRSGTSPGSFHTVHPDIEMKRMALYDNLISDVAKSMRSQPPIVSKGMTMKNKNYRENIKKLVLNWIYAQKVYSSKCFGKDPVFAVKEIDDVLYKTIMDYGAKKDVAVAAVRDIDLPAKLKFYHDKMAEWIRVNGSGLSRPKIRVKVGPGKRGGKRRVFLTCVSSRGRKITHDLPQFVYDRLRGRFQETSWDDSSGGRPMDVNVLIWCMLARYYYLGGLNHHLAVPPATKNLLNRVYGIDHELFASMINAHYTHFCSAFPDIENWFGTMGNHFDQAPVSGWVMSNPPYEESILEKSMAHVVLCLQNAKKKGEFLGYVITAPVWDKNGQAFLRKFEKHTANINKLNYGNYKALDIILSSGFLHDALISTKKEHRYLDYFANTYKCVSSTYTFLLATSPVSRLPPSLPGKRVRWSNKRIYGIDSRR